LDPNIRPKKSHPKSVKRRRRVLLGLDRGIGNKIKIGKRKKLTSYFFSYFYPAKALFLKYKLKARSDSGYAYHPVMNTYGSKT
jgi:hypothetical protein